MGKRDKISGNRIGYARSVAELLPRVGRKSFHKFGFMESAIVSRWAEIVGGDIARKSTPDAIRFPRGKRVGGTLNLSVHGAHALAIQHDEPRILECINRYFGYAAVARIAIRQGEAPRQSAVAPAQRETKPLSADTARELKAIEDDGLRAALESLAAQIGVTTGPPKIS